MINVIFKLSEHLEDCPDIEWDNFQARLQIKVNALWDYDFTSMHGKEGIIRDMLLGGSLNKIGRHKTDLIAGTSVKHQLPTKYGDRLGAMGNSGDMVIKVIPETIRSEASEMMCVQRLGKPVYWAGSRRRMTIRNGRLSRNRDEDIVYTHY